MAKEKTSKETSETTTRPSGIIVADPETFRPKVLPLIITFPEGYNDGKGPSKAQIERAKVLNGFAYAKPEKWAVEKEEQLRQLEALKDAADPVEDPNSSLTVGPAVPKNVI